MSNLTRITSEELMAELERRGVRVDVWACGCCSSPEVFVVIDGERFFEDCGSEAVIGSMTEKQKRRLRKIGLS